MRFFVALCASPVLGSSGSDWLAAGGFFSFLFPQASVVSPIEVPSPVVRLTMVDDPPEIFGSRVFKVDREGFPLTEVDEETGQVGMEDFWVDGCESSSQFWVLSRGEFHWVELSTGPANLPVTHRLSGVSLGTGNMFDAEISVRGSLAFLLHAGLDSGFAVANPVFTLALRLARIGELRMWRLKSLITTSLTAAESVIQDTSFSYYPVLERKGRWSIEGGEISIDGNHPTHSLTMTLVSNQNFIGLDSNSWNLFWRGQSTYRMQRYKSEDDSDYWVVASCNQLAIFPSITITIGNYVANIPPARYVRLLHKNRCEVRIQDMGPDTAVLGVPFFMTTIVQFDNYNRRVGFGVPAE